MGKSYFDTESGHYIEVNSNIALDTTTGKEYLLNPDHSSFTEHNPGDGRILGDTRFAGNVIHNLEESNYDFYGNEQVEENYNVNSQTNYISNPRVTNGGFTEEGKHKFLTILLRVLKIANYLMGIGMSLLGLGIMVYSLFADDMSFASAAPSGLMLIGLGVVCFIVFPMIVIKFIQRFLDNSYSNYYRTAAPRYRRKGRKR